MMWTNPNEDNNFTVSAKCRIGHSNDILAVVSSSQFIVSGGVDGFLSIWNLFSGVLKYAIELPPPSKIVLEKAMNLMNHSSDSIDSNNESDLNDRISVPQSNKKPKKVLKKQRSFYNESKVIHDEAKP